MPLQYAASCYAFGIDMPDGGTPPAPTPPVKNGTKKSAAKKPHHIPWLTLAFGLAALFVMFFSSNISRLAPVPTMRITSSDPIIPKGIQVSPSAPMAQSAPAYYEAGAPSSLTYRTPPSPPYYGDTPDINDTREFNKTSYSAAMKTRDVQGLTRRVETTIRGTGGRVDQTNSSPKSGYVSFVIPASKFDSFRGELESLVDSRFLEVSISSQNLLPQKQEIEANQEHTTESLEELQASRAKLVSDHNKRVASLQAQIDSDQEELDILMRAPVPDQIQMSVFLDDITNLRAQLAAENSSHAAQLADSDARIKSVQGRLENYNQQDENLMDDVATVNGSVSLRWISLWEFVQLYIPAWAIAALLLVCAIIAQLWHRRNWAASGVL